MHELHCKFDVRVGEITQNPANRLSSIVSFCKHSFFLHGKAVTNTVHAECFETQLECNLLSHLDQGGSLGSRNQSFV